MFPRQNFLSEGISDGGRRINDIELDGQLGTNANAELLRHFADRAPAHGGVRANGLSHDEGDFFVTEIAKMFEGQPGGTLVIQHDVGQTFDSLVSCDRDGWQWKRLR